jgi:nucleoside-diphosphate-sugar epimerase
VTYIKINLFNKKKICYFLKEKKFKYLIHLAWEARPKIFWNSKNNINFFHASTNLYYNFCKFGGKYAILAGSSAEYSLTNKIVVEKEAAQKFTFSKYSISKYLFMKNVKKISNIFESDFAWARLFWIYGKNQPNGKLISDIARHIKKKKNFVIQNKNDSINLMNVKDVASSLFMLFRFRVKGIVNVASKNNFKIFEIISMIKNNNIRNKIILKNNNKSYLFKKIIVNKLKSIGFKEKFNIKYDINSLLK